MDINTLIDDLAEGIGGSTDIRDWCVANYGQPVTVFLNLDMRNLPTANQCPAVCVYPSEKQYGGDTYNDAVETMCMIHDDRAQAYGEYPNVVAYAGVKNVETLRKMVLREISAIVEETANGQIEGIAVDYDTISQFPFVSAAMAVALSAAWTLGSGNPAENE